MGAFMLKGLEFHHKPLDEESNDSALPFLQTGQCTVETALGIKYNVIAKIYVQEEKQDQNTFQFASSLTNKCRVWQGACMALRSALVFHG